MARPVDAPSGAPFAKLNNLGDKLIGAFAGGRSRQQINFKTRALETKDDGTPRLEEIMHFIAMPGTTAQKGDVQGGHGEPIEPGSHVRYAVSGFKWGQVIQGRKALPPHAGFPAGKPLSGDVYEIVLAGWSVGTDNAEAARKAGFTVIDGRIVMRTQEEKDNYVLARSRQNLSATVGNDFTIAVRRTTAAEAEWETLADDLFDTKPWEQGGQEPAMAGGGGAGPDPVHGYEEPF